MTRQTLTIGAVATALALSAVPSWAAPQAGSRPNTGSTVGSAAPRGGGEGSSSGSTSSSSGSSDSRSGGSSSMGAGSSGASPWGGAGQALRRPAAPERPSYGDQRRGGGAGMMAVPRASGAPAGRTGSSDTNAAAAFGGGPAREAVPTYSRPRGNRPAVGQAAERQPPAPGQGGGYYPTYPGGGYYGGYYPVYYDPFYYGGYGYYGSYWGYNNCGLAYSCYSNPWGYYSPFLMPGYGYGVGYFGYDPWYDPFGGDMYGYGGYGGGGGYSSSEDADTGSVRLKVKPGSAQVFVDGYYVGTVDSFDGAFQKLTVAAGPHKIELRADGYQPEVIQVLVQPGETVAFKGDLKRVK